MPKSKRKHRSAATIKQILSDYHPSGLSQEKFCKESQIPYSTFHRWLTVSRRTNQMVLPAIIPIGTFPSPTPSIEVELPQGQIIRLSSGVNSDALKAVLTALRRC